MPRPRARRHVQLRQALSRARLGRSRLPRDNSARRPLRLRILSQDAAPYRWLGPQLAAVMPAHVVYDAVDPAPAGFSRHWMDILRKDLGFVGAAFTDDLLMEGASTQGSLPERAAAGLAAGCDLVLVCNDTAAMDTVLEQLSWRRTAQFDQRFARLRPRGPAYPMAELVRTELYRQALEDVRSLAPEA